MLLKFLFFRRRGRWFRRIVIGGAIFILLLFFYVLYGILKTEETAIEKIIFNGARALEDKDHETIESMISESYFGEIGKNRMEVLTIAQNALSRAQTLKIKIKTIDIILQEEDAVSVKCLFDYSGYYVGSHIYHRAPLSGRFLRDAAGEAELEFAREGNRWLIRYMTLVLNDHRYF